MPFGLWIGYGVCYGERQWLSNYKPHCLFYGFPWPNDFSASNALYDGHGLEAHGNFFRIGAHISFFYCVSQRIGLFKNISDAEGHCDCI